MPGLVEHIVGSTTVSRVASSRPKEPVMPCVSPRWRAGAVQDALGVTHGRSAPFANGAHGKISPLPDLRSAIVVRNGCRVRT